MKKLINILIIIFSLFPIGIINCDYVPSGNNIIPNTSSSTNRSNEYLEELGGKEKGDIVVSNNGEKSLVELLYTIAYDIKIVMYLVAGIYFLILVIKLLFASKTEEGVTKFRNGIIWISIGIVVMQIAYYYVNVLYAKEIGGNLAGDFTTYIIMPIIKVLETATSFLFVFIMIYAFYRMVTANGDDGKVKEGRMSILYALIGFIVVKLSKEIVYATYGQIDCNERTIWGIIQVSGSNCITDSNLSGVVAIIAKIINWINSFVGIVIIIMILYAGVQVLLSNGDEEKLKNAKNTIIYVAIGVAILALNYFIMSFFIKPEIAI